MNLGELQAELRHFAAERDWQPFHTPKNLTTALMVEAAELAEIFQWQTPEDSRLAHSDAAAKQRIGEEVADVLLYLLQVADHCQIDVPQAVQDKLARNAVKYPAKRAIPRVSPTRASVPGTHVLLDFENVQPSDAELRALVPDADQVWVFHGPHQREVEKRFGSFGAGATAVPISKTGKNALDFHLSFYMGYIASRNPDSAMVVVANDKGYEPMLEHAKAMGFVVRRQPHGEVKTPAKKAAAKKVSAKNAPAKKVAAKAVAAKKAAPKKVVAAKTAASPAAKTAPTKKVAAVKKPSPAKKVAAATGGTTTPERANSAATVAAVQPASPTSSAQPLSEVVVRRMIEGFRKMGANRPPKLASLRRALKPLLGALVSEQAIALSVERLLADGVVTIDPQGVVRYPSFGPDAQGAKGAETEK
jgi:NTP pyrophosphatase (non-canonical NTP hydrolase)